MRRKSSRKTGPDGGPQLRLAGRNGLSTNSAALPSAAGNRPGAVTRRCAPILALVGGLPLALGFLVRSNLVRHWAARKTEALLGRLVGVEASYVVGVQLLPLHLVLDDVVVHSSDGGSPALSARRITVTPRLFSLLAGRLDAGDVEIEEPHARVVVRDGKLANVRYRLPTPTGPTAPLERAPFASLSLTDAAVSFDMDGVRVDSGPIDLDVFASNT